MLKRFLIICVMSLALVGCVGKKPYAVDWQRGISRGFFDKSVTPSLKAASPILATDAGGRDILFLGTRDGGFLALEANYLRPLWRLKRETIFEAPAVIDGDLLYVGNLSGELLAMRWQSGEVVWTYEGETGILSQPLVVDDLVVVSNNLSTVLALDKKKGEVIWRFREDPQEGVTFRGNASMVFDAKSNQLIVGTSRGELIALNKRDGRVAWRQAVAKQGRYMDIDGTPVVVDDRILAAAVSGPLAAFDSRGVLLWQNDAIKTQVRVVVEGDKVYAVTLDSELYCISLKDGTTLWQRDMGGESVPTTMLLDDDRLVVGFSDGWLLTLLSKSGDLLWRYRLGDRISGNILRLKDGFIAMNGKQVLFRFKRQ